MDLRRPFVRLLGILSFTVVLSSSAHAEETEWRSLSDTRALRSGDSARTSLDLLAAQLASDVEANGTAAPAQATTLSPEMAAQMRGFRDQAVAAIEAQLKSTDPVKDAERYKVLTSSLEQTRASYAQMLGESPASSSSPAATPTPTATATTTWRIPAFGTREPSLAEALADLHRLVDDNSPPEALQAFRASEDYASAVRCSAMAATAVLARRDVAALAAWLRAHELEPRTPETLINLGALAVRIGLPRHALPLLAAAEKNLQPSVIRSGINLRAVILNQRGQSLVLLKRFVPAEGILREAVRLEPALSEARINLAHALYQQTDPRKKQEAVALMLVARRRSATIFAQSPPTSESSKPATDAEAGPKTNTAGSPANDGRPLARDVFDLSHGKAGSLATIKIPRTIADAHAMWPALKKFKDEISAENKAVTQRMLVLSKRMRQIPPDDISAQLAYDRAQDIFYYIAHAWSEPELRSLHDAYTKAEQDHGVGIHYGQFENPFDSREMQETADHIAATTRGNYRAYCEQMYDLSETFHKSWLEPIHTLDTDVNRYARAYYSHATAIAANLSHPVYHEYAMLLVRSQMLSLTMTFLQPLEAVCRFHYQNLQDWGRLRGEGATAEFVAASYPEADWCPGGLRGNYSAGLNLELFSVALNCEKVGFELSAGVWLKGFLAVDQMFDGSGTFFVGVAADASAPVGVLGVGATLKGGLYLSVDQHGNVSDFGLQVSRTSSVGIGPLSYSQEIGNTFSLVTALSN